MTIHVHFFFFLICFFFCIHHCSLLYRPGQHLRPHRHVLVLRPGSHWPAHAEVPVVEEIPHVPAAGKRLRLQHPVERLSGAKTVFLLPGAVPALPPPHGLQPVHRVRLPRFHEHPCVWLLRHAHHPLQQLLLPELPQQEEEEVVMSFTPDCSAQGLH